MPGSIRYQKLRRPKVPKFCIERPRLLDKIDRHFSRNAAVFLLAAPPGYGKTILAAQWAAALESPTVWFSAGEGENDFVVFFAHLFHGLKREFPSLLDGDPEIDEALGNRDPAALSGLLIERFDAFDSRVAIVLDNFHNISDSMVHEFFADFIETVPENLFILFLTREDPRFRLSKLRIEGKLGELREADLRFTRDETTAILRAGLEPEPTAGEVEKIVEKTEGWPVVVTLLMLFLEGTAGGYSGLIDDFSGSNRHMIDYFLEEVLINLQPELLNFITDTVRLEQFTPEACDDLRGKGDSAELIAGLLEKKLPIMVFPGEPKIYRYTSLFADFIKSNYSCAAPCGKSRDGDGSVFLSRREKEIMALMAEGFQNREIADRLFISLSTVKWHANNIFAKLDATGRMKAVAEARRRNLI